MAPTYTTCPDCGHLCATQAPFCTRCGCRFDEKALQATAATAPPADEDAAVIVFGNVQDAPEAVASPPAMPGAAPGLPPLFDEPPPSRGAGLWLGAVLLALLLAAGVGWWWWSGREAAPAMPAAGADVAAPATEDPGPAVDAAAAGAAAADAVPADAALAPGEALEAAAADVARPGETAAQPVTVAPPAAAIVQDMAPAAASPAPPAPRQRAAEPRPARPPAYKRSLDELLD
ncbi:hypothetical protein GCM10027082_40550 [Comamonas humi]